MSQLANLWRDLPDRIGFFTKETSHRIPESTGVYGWFIPLWLYAEDVESYISLVRGILNYDPQSGRVPERSVEAGFNWRRINVVLRDHPKVETTVRWKKKWQEMMGSKAGRSAFQTALMEASVFLPPLYVGKADNLRRRYLQHVEGRVSSDRNTFHQRFSRFADEVEISLDVDDLLFVCIETESSTNVTLRELELNDLLEEILLRVAAPPFSLR